MAIAGEIGQPVVRTAVNPGATNVPENLSPGGGGGVILCGFPSRREARSRGDRSCDGDAAPGAGSGCMFASAFDAPWYGDGGHSGIGLYVHQPAIAARHRPVRQARKSDGYSGWRKWAARSGESCTTTNSRNALPLRLSLCLRLRMPTSHPARWRVRSIRCAAA